MRMVRLIVAAGLICGVPSLQGLQKRPDFTGTWVEDERQRKSPYSTTVAGGGAKAMSGPPPDVVITQTPERITIEQTFMTVSRMVYEFDGREDVNRTGAQTHTTRTRWDGDRLVTEGTVFQVTNMGEDTWKVREVRWLNGKGEMVVERTTTGEDDDPKTVVRVFRRKR